MICQKMMAMLHSSEQQKTEKYLGSGKVSKFTLQQKAKMLTMSQWLYNTNFNIY